MTKNQLSDHALVNERYMELSPQTIGNNITLNDDSIKMQLKDINDLDKLREYAVSMLKANAKVRRSDLERCENAVGSRRS